MFLNYRLNLKSQISFLSILYFFSLKQFTFANQDREIMDVKSNCHYYFFHAEIYVIKNYMQMCERTWCGIIRSILVTMYARFFNLIEEVKKMKKKNNWEIK